MGFFLARRKAQIFGVHWHPHFADDFFLARMKTKNCGVHLHLHFTDIRTFSIFVKTTILLIIMAGRYARCTTFIKIQIFPNFSCCM